MRRQPFNTKGFGLAGVSILIVVLAAVAGGDMYVYYRGHKAQRPASSSATSNMSSKTNTATVSKIHTPQEAVNLVQQTYDDYLRAVNGANGNGSNSQPVAQVGLEAVKANLSSGMYAQSAAVTQATPFSCTAQYVADSYTASLSSSDNTSALIAVSISNGGNLLTDGMKVTVDLSTLEITSITCPS